MSKIVLNDITNTGQVSVINSNFDKIEAAMNNQVLYRNNPTGEPNALITNVDANGRRIYNLPKAITLNEPLRWQDLLDINSNVPGISLPIGASDVGVIPNAGVSSTNVQSALEELSTEIAAIGRGGGGGGSAPLGGITIPNFTIDQNTAKGRIEILGTNPKGWNLDAGRMDLQFDFYSADYFAKNPTGHLAIVLRCDMTTLGTAVRGQGMLFGNVSGAPNGSDLYPTPLLETWFGNTSNPAGNTIFRNSDGARALGGVKDNVQYRVQVTATKTAAGTRHLRYSLWSWNATYQYWVHEVDTGDVLDANVWADLTSHGLVFGHVFASAGQTWQLNFTNVKVTWGPCETFTPDQTTKLSRYGAELDGNLRYLGIARRTLIRSNDANPTSWTLFAAHDGPQTRVASAPGGGGNSSEFVAFSTADANYTGAAVGMAGSRGYVRTYRGGSAASVPLDFMIDGTVKATMTYANLTLFQDFNFNGSRSINTTDWLALNIAGSPEVAVFKTNSIKLKGASTELMTPMNYMAGIVNWNNTHATSFGDSSNPLNWAELCIPGGIARFVGATPSGSSVELAMRPIACAVANIITELRNRRIFKFTTD